MNQKNTVEVAFGDTFRIFITCTITLTVLNRVLKFPLMPSATKLRGR